eukprot:7246197-Prymnesium_polylepis.2
MLLRKRPLPRQCSTAPSLDPLTSTDAQVEIEVFPNVHVLPVTCPRSQYGEVNDDGLVDVPPPKRMLGGRLEAQAIEADQAKLG